MIAIMVEQFRDIRLRLAETIARCETPEFASLDHQASELFERIYRHEPKDAAEARVILHFFLDMIQDNDDGGSRYLIERIRAIIDRCDGEYPPSSENDAGI